MTVVRSRMRRPSRRGIMRSPWRVELQGPVTLHARRRAAYLRFQVSGIRFQGSVGGRSP
jgi:hypothetical protein